MKVQHTVGPGVTARPLARASHPRIKEISLMSALTSRAFVLLDLS